MNASELRIGNWVRNKTHNNNRSQKLYKARSIGQLKCVVSSEDNHTDVFSYGHLEGIPLTEEWLKRMGFILKEDVGYFAIYGTVRFHGDYLEL